MKRSLPLAIALCSIGFASQADTDRREELIVKIVNAATHNTDKERHTVSIEGCMMTTFVYQPHKDHGFILWSSWLVDLQGLEIPKLDRPSGRRFIFNKKKSGDGTAITLFKMIRPFTTRHEFPEFRKLKGESKPSPRKGVVDYFYRTKNSFIIVQESLASDAKPQNFVTYLLEYKRDYCQPLG